MHVDFDTIWWLMVCEVLSVIPYIWEDKNSIYAAIFETTNLTACIVSNFFFFAIEQCHHVACVCVDWMKMKIPIFKKKYLKIGIFFFKIGKIRERSGSVVECLTRDRSAADSSLTGVTALWSLSKTHLSKLSTGSTQEYPSLFNWKIVDGT